MITEAEQKYIKLCDEVSKRALRVSSAATLDKSNRAADLALALCDFVADEKQAILMRSERAEPSAYNLAALHVDASAPSNSETGFEDRG